MDKTQRFVCKFEGEIIPLLDKRPPVPDKSLNPYVSGFAAVEIDGYSTENKTYNHFSFNEEGLNQLVTYLLENPVDDCSFLRDDIQKEWDVGKISGIPICNSFSMSYPGSTLTLTYKAIPEQTFRDKIKNAYGL